MSNPQAVIPVAVIDERLKEITDRLTALEREATPLVAELNALKALKTRAVTYQSPSDQRDDGTDASYVASVHPREGVTLTDQLLEYIAKRPGLTSTEIATNIVAGGFSKGSNPRKNVLTTLGFMVTKGRVRKDEQGRHYPVGETRQLNLVANG